MGWVSGILAAIPLINKLVDGVAYAWKSVAKLIKRKKHKKIDDAQDSHDVSKIL